MESARNAKAVHVPGRSNDGKTSVLLFLLLLNRFFDGLHEKRLLLFRSQPGGVLVGIALLGIVIPGHALIAVVEDAPDDAKPRHLHGAFAAARLRLLGRYFLLGLGRFFFVFVAGFIACFSVSVVGF